MLNFEVLASSSAGCCYKLSGGGAKAPLLIEAGISFRNIQIGLNFEASELAGCIISHAHGDHITGAKELMHHGVDCYASHQTWMFSESMAYRSKEIWPKQTIQIKDWDVTAFGAVHDQPGTLGFVVGSPDGFRLLYLTDSAYSPFRFEGLTHVCVEANFDDEIIKENVTSGAISMPRWARTKQTHMSLKVLIEMLKANDLSKVEEIHLLHLSDANSDEAKFKSEVEKATGVPVFIAAKTLAGASK